MKTQKIVLLIVLLLVLTGVVFAQEYPADVQAELDRQLEAIYNAWVWQVSEVTISVWCWFFCS